MYAALLIAGIILIAALIAFSHWCCYRAGREDGYEQGRADRSAAELAERKAERHEARHARTQPRTAPVTPKPDPEPHRITWDRDEAVGGPVDIPVDPALTGYIEAMRAMRKTPVSVVLPEPGTYLPQPVRSTAPDTGTFAKVELVDASTGEMRAVTDKFIAEHCS